jgi:hypothetical protein
MGSPVEHGAVIIRVKNAEVIEYAGIETDMDDEKANEEKTRQCHHDFSTNRGSEEL